MMLDDEATKAQWTMKIDMACLGSFADDTASSQPNSWSLKNIDGNWMYLPVRASPGGENYGQRANWSTMRGRQFR